MTETSNLQQTPLYSLASDCGAKFTEFAGWNMALQYSGLKKEHQAVRESVGMFDISHMGKFFLKGKDLRQKLSYLVPSDLTSLKKGKAQYTLLLNQKAGIIDDVIFYYQGKDEQEVEHGVLIVNAATTVKDWDWLTENLDISEIDLQDFSRELALIALQGVKAQEYLSPMVEDDLDNLSSFAHLSTQIYGEDAFIARTGYTGEDGFEIMTTPSVAEKLWTLLLSKEVTPCGLGARDTLRLEAGMCLYSQDMNEETTPLEASLGWVINWEHDFISKDILVEQKQQGISKKLVALQMQGKHIARHGYPLLVDNKTIGEITSGTLSPTLNQAIALGYVSQQYSKVGQELAVEIRGKQYNAQVVKKPFYRGSAQKAKSKK